MNNHFQACAPLIFGTVRFLKFFREVFSDFQHETLKPCLHLNCCSLEQAEGTNFATWRKEPFQSKIHHFFRFKHESSKWIGVGGPYSMLSILQNCLHSQNSFFHLFLLFFSIVYITPPIAAIKNNANNIIPGMILESTGEVWY